MGKIKFRFHLEGVDIDQISPDILLKHPNYFWTNFNYHKICLIEFVGYDFVIDVELNNVSLVIDWEKLNYPSEIVKGKVLEIFYYETLAKDLKDILHEIDLCRFEDKYKLDTLGKQAITRISNSNKPTYLKGMLFYKDDSIGNINYTLNKEVKSLITYIKYKDSQKRKDTALYEAIHHLNSDIGSVIFSLENYDVNK